MSKVIVDTKIPRTLLYHVAKHAGGDTGDMSAYVESAPSKSFIERWMDEKDETISGEEGEGTASIFSEDQEGVGDRRSPTYSVGSLQVEDAWKDSGRGRGTMKTSMGSKEGGNKEYIPEEDWFGEDWGENGDRGEESDVVCDAEDDFTDDESIRVALSQVHDDLKTGVKVDDPVIMTED
ncbi:hypothetical protein OC861_006730, partial [Tilletia horrida]